VQELSRFFKALGDETRLRLIALLARQEPGRALCVSRLACELGVTPSAVSQHLRVLRHLGLVRKERRAHRLHYFLDQERLAEYRDLAQASLGVALFIENDPERSQEVTEMCRRDKCGCEHPEKKKDSQTCSPERIQECHGEVQEHPCEHGQ